MSRSGGRSHGLSGVSPAALALPRRLSALLARAWERGLLSRPALDPAALIAKAERLEGAALQPGAWRDGLDRLAADLAGPAALNPLGEALAHGQLVKLLRHRIRAERLIARRPEIAAASLPPPVVILGQMRSGTTRLHRMLACDPRFSFTRQHESLSPLARSRMGAVAAARTVQALLHACNRELAPIHPSGPSAAEEEFGLHALSFHGAMFEAQWAVPAYSAWDDGRDLVAVYREFARWLALLRWRRGDPSERIPLLKAPQFLEDLEALIAAFPGARILRLDRDLATVAASTASLVWHQRRIQSDAADPRAIGREWLERTRLRAERAATVLARRPDVPVLSVDYQEMGADWRGEVQRIYRFLDLSLPERVKRRMARVAASTRHRAHRYDAEMFGLASKRGMVDALGLEPRTR